MKIGANNCRMWKTYIDNIFQFKSIEGNATLFVVNIFCLLYISQIIMC